MLPSGARGGYSVRIVKVSCVQFAPRIGRVADNLARICASVKDADLAVFPECALTGYGFDSREEALRVAETVPGPSTEEVAKACKASGAHAVVGLLESAAGRLFNAAAIVGPDGVAGIYRKMHLPFLGVDRFLDRGDLGFPVFDLPFAKVGVLICYDLSFPEASRVLKLAGAQVIVVPTNWPERAEVSCDHAPPVRAQENHVHVVTCNRAGEESGFRFIGRSRVIRCTGEVLAQAGAGEETISAEVEPALADRNRVVNVAGKYELDRIGHRRPDFYGPVTR